MYVQAFGVIPHGTEVEFVVAEILVFYEAISTLLNLMEAEFVIRVRTSGVLHPTIAFSLIPLLEK